MVNKIIALAIIFGLVHNLVHKICVKHLSRLKLYLGVFFFLWINIYRCDLPVSVAVEYMQ